MQTVCPYALNAAGREPAVGRRELDVRSGFTFIELLVVLILVALVVGLSVPVLAITSRAAFFRSQLTRIRLQCDYVRQRAELEQRAYYIRFIPDAAAYESGPVRSDAYETDGSGTTDSLLSRRSLGSRITLEWSRDDPQSPEIVFFPDGTCTAAEFRVIDREGRTAEVVISRSGEFTSTLSP